MPLAPPLLHIAETVATATTVDLRLIVVAAALLVVSLAVIWSPPPLVHLRRRRRRAASAAMGMLAFLAVLPAMLPYDHLFFHHDDEPALAGHVDAHATHCHESPGSCADAPLASGPGQFLTSEPLVVVPAMVSVLILLAAPVLLGISQRPDTPPPVRRLAFA